MKASEFRYCYILPSPKIDEMASKEVKGIKFFDQFWKKGPELPWYKYEDLIWIDFDSSFNCDGLIIKKICGECGGECCKRIPEHQIGIYFSSKEVLKIRDAGKDDLLHFKGQITVGGKIFLIGDTEANGDCAMLGPDGCLLGEDRPLWCKIYHCEKFTGRSYPWEKH